MSIFVSCRDIRFPAGCRRKTFRSCTNRLLHNADDFTITLTTTDKGMAANGYQAPENWQHNGAFT
ncbi:hypothetical protein AALD01_19550, partial [Oscillospiraceae bacterium 21-37]